MKLHLFQFVDEASAIADTLIGTFHQAASGNPNDPDFYLPPAWMNNVFPDIYVSMSGVQESGWWCIVASADTNTDLATSLNCRIAWDNENAIVLGGTYTGNEIAQLYVSPVPAGSYNPWP